MNKLFLIPAALLLFSCNQSDTASNQEAAETSAVEINPDYDYFGDTISVQNATSLADFESKIASEGSLDTKIEGKVVEVCQAKGCWMDIELLNGELMKVKFKDYGFFVPFDIAGSTVILEGNGYQDTTSVEELRHYAEDAGRTQEEIEQITEPSIGIRFLASGVAVKKQGN